MQAPTKKKNKSGKNLIGLEYENQLVYLNSGFPVVERDVLRLWDKMAKSGWEPMSDQYYNVVNGVRKNINSGEVIVNTDTGICNVEMAMPPCEDIHIAKKEYEEIREEILSYAKDLGFSMISLGSTPRPFEINCEKMKTRKTIYTFMKDRFPLHNVMLPISAHQVCIDVDFDNVIDTINSLMRLSGFIIAATSNSVTGDNRLLKWKESRYISWKFLCGTGAENTENLAHKYPRNPFKNLSDYFNFGWQSLPLFLIKDGKWLRIKDPEVTINDYLFKDGSVEAEDPDGNISYVKANKDDINLMMMYVWPDARAHIVIDDDKVDFNEFLESINNESVEEYISDKILKCYLEIRMCSVGPKGEEMAIPALLLGLINNLGKTKEFSSLVKWEEASDLRDRACVQGMNFEFKGKKASEYIKEMVEISREGLVNRGLGEETYLDPFLERIEKEQTPADKTIDLLKKGGVDLVIKENIY